MDDFDRVLLARMKQQGVAAMRASRALVSHRQADMPCQCCGGVGFLSEHKLGLKDFWHVRCRDCGCSSPSAEVFLNDGRLGWKPLEDFKRANKGLTPGGVLAMAEWVQMHTWIANGKLLADEANAARTANSTKGRL